MCGIIVARDLSNHSVNKLVWGQFEKQKARGVEGFGAFDGASIFKTPKLKKMRGWLRNDKHQSDFLMFHHRWPTSTVNVRRAAHPFGTADYFGNVKYVLVHNGHVSNSAKLKLEHEALGISYTSTLQDGSFNDSESLLWDIALTLEGKQDKMTAYGGIAFVAAKLVDGEITHLYFGKNAGRPLNLFRENAGIMLSSEGEGEPIDDHQLYTYNYKLNRLTKRYFRIPSYDPSYDYKGSTNRSTYTPSPNGNVCNTYYGFPAAWGTPRTQDSPRYIPSRWEEDEDEDYFYDDGDSDEVGTFTYRRTGGAITGIDLIQQDNEQDWFLNEYIETSTEEITVKEVYDSYMTMNGGDFSAAFDMMDTDLDHFLGHNQSAKRDLITQMLEGAMIRLTQEEGFYEDAYELEQEQKQPALMPLSLIGAGQEG